nr:hypothetical protein [Treponema denticola]
MGLAKASLTSSRTGAYPPFYAVNRAGSRRAVNGLDDFGFGYCFAAADNMAVERIFFYKRILFFCTKAGKMSDCSSIFVKIFLFIEGDF